MTFIQPNKEKNSFNKAAAILVVCLIFAVVWLVMIYNRFVNVSHGISQAKADFQTVQAENAELKDRIIKLTDSINSGNTVAKNNLIREKNPAYFEIASQWSYVSEH